MKRLNNYVEEDEGIGAMLCKQGQVYVVLVTNYNAFAEEWEVMFMTYHNTKAEAIVEFDKEVTRIKKEVKVS